MKKHVIIAMMCVVLIGCGSAANKAVELLGSLVGGFASSFLNDSEGDDSGDRRLPNNTSDRYDDGIFVYDDKEHYRGTYEEDDSENPDVCADALGGTVPSTLSISELGDDQLVLNLDDNSQAFTYVEQDELDMYVYEFQGSEYSCIVGFASRFVDDEEQQDILALYCQELETEDTCDMLFVRDD